MNKNPRLMVVDNEIDICNFVKSFFEMRGFEVSTAVNGEEGLDRLIEDKPRVVLLDVMMRYEGEGIEYLQKFKEKDPGVKVIMVTGVEDDEMIEKARSLGADDYITKPLILEYLEGTVLAKIQQLNKAA